MVINAEYVFTKYTITYILLFTYVIFYNIIVYHLVTIPISGAILDRMLLKMVRNRYKNRVKQCRLKALVETQADLAKLTGISRSTLNNIENNKIFLSSYYGLLIAEALGCSLSDLYERKDGGNGK